MMTNEDHPKLLTTSQAAAYLKVSQGSIRRWADLGLIEYFRTPGNQRRFSEVHLDAAMARQPLRDD